MNRVFNFYPGPAALPTEVLEQAQKELLNFQNAGMSVMELSHRSQEFESVLDRAENGLKTLMGVPDTHAICFVGGGASLQFSMVPMNLALEGKSVDLIQTGTWSKKALTEIKRHSPVNIAGTSEAKKFTCLPKAADIHFDPNASFAYLCANNTIEGTQWFQFPDTGAVPLVADMTSDILSQPVEVSKFGLIFAGAQKNLGPSGVTVVIIRKDLVERGSDQLPTMLQYRTHVKERSLYNTPPTFPIYVMALVMEWMERQGGVQALFKRNKEKAGWLYDAIDNSKGFYSCPVVKEDRSLMNVVFRVKGGSDEMEKKFLKQAEASDLIGLEGHRSVGGLRASIYNLQPVEAVRKLVDFMRDFQKRES